MKKNLKKFALIIVDTIFRSLAEIVGASLNLLKKMHDDFDELLSTADEDDDGILDAEDQEDDRFHDEEPDEEAISAGRRIPSRREEKLNGNKITSSLPKIAAGAGTLAILARAFQSHEGWFPPGGKYPRGSSSFRNNNPGNLKFVGQAGATGKDERGFAIFSSFDGGWQALLRDLGIKLRRTPDHSIISLITEYEGGDPENPPGNDLAYAENVARQLSEATGKTITIHTKIKNV